MRWALAAVLSAGCLDIHAFHGDAGTDPTGDGGVSGSEGACGSPTIASTGWPRQKVTAAMPDNVLTVAGPGYTFAFSVIKPNFPVSFSVEAMELLSGNPGAGACEEGGFATIRIAPGARGDLQTMDSAALTLVAAGPGIVRVDQHWTSSFGCGAAVVDSAWTFFPDGRITRDDVLESASFSPGPPCACGGTASSLETIASEMSLVDGPVGRAVDTADHPTLLDHTAAIELPEQFCLTGKPSQSFQLFQLEQPGRHVTARKTTSVNHSIATRWNTPGPAIANGTRASTTFFLAPASITCSALSASVAGFRDGVDLRVNGLGALAAPRTDGVVGGFETGMAAAGHTVLAIPTGKPSPPGYAVGLSYATAPSTISVAKNGVLLDSDAAVIQRVDADPRHVVIWLRDPFGGDGSCDQVTVDAAF